MKKLELSFLGAHVGGWGEEAPRPVLLSSSWHLYLHLWKHPCLWTWWVWACIWTWASLLPTCQLLRLLLFFTRLWLLQLQQSRYEVLTLKTVQSIDVMILFQIAVLQAPGWSLALPSPGHLMVLVLSLPAMLVATWLPRWALTKQHLVAREWRMLASSSPSWGLAPQLWRCDLLLFVKWYCIARHNKSRWIGTLCTLNLRNCFGRYECALLVGSLALVGYLFVKEKVEWNWSLNKMEVLKIPSVIPSLQATECAYIPPIVGV